MITRNFWELKVQSKFTSLVWRLRHAVFPEFYPYELWDEGHSIKRKVCVYGKSARKGGVHCRAFLTCPPKCRHSGHCREDGLLNSARPVDFPY